MSKNMTNLIFNEVSRLNRNSVSASIKTLREDREFVEDTEEVVNDYPYDNTTEKFCPRCGRTYTEFPAWSRYDNKTMICPDCGVEEAMINYTGGKLTNPHVFDKDTGIMLSDTERREKFGEEVNIENPSAEEIERDNENIETAKRKEVEDRIDELKKALADEGIAEDEKQAMEDEIKELQAMLEAADICLEEGKKIPIHNEVSNEEIIQMFRQMVKDNPKNEKAKEFLKKYDPEYKEEKEIKKESVLTEAPEDEEPELIDEPTGEEDLPIEEPTDEEMTDAEYEDEVEEDKEDTVEDAVEEPFYATTPEFDELRDLLVDLDYRLFLINDNMVCIGRLNGPDIEFLTSNRPENTETEPSEQNDKAEEIENKAEEDGEQAFEYKWIKAPDSLDKFLNQVNVVYLSPEMSDEDREQYAGIEASHESVMDFLMNELPEDKREEHENEEIEDTLEDIPEEIPMEEPIEDTSEEEYEFNDEELPEENEEEEEE